MRMHKTIKGFYGSRNPIRLQLLQSRLPHVSKMEKLWECDDVEAIFAAPYVLDIGTLRRFLCWSVRQVWHLLPDERSRAAVLAAEGHADGKISKEQLKTAMESADEVLGDDTRKPFCKPFAVHCAEMAGWGAANPNEEDLTYYAFDTVHRACIATAADANPDTRREDFSRDMLAAFSVRAAHLRATVPNPFA